MKNNLKHISLSFINNSVQYLYLDSLNCRRDEIKAIVF